MAVVWRAEGGGKPAVSSPCLALAKICCSSLFFVWWVYSVTLSAGIYIYMYPHLKMVGARPTHFKAMEYIVSCTVGTRTKKYGTG